MFKCPSQPWSDTWRTYGLHDAVFSGYKAGKNGAELPATNVGDIGAPASLVIMSENGVTNEWNTCDELSSDFYWHGGGQWPPVMEGPTSGAKYDRDPVSAAEMSTLPDSWTYRAFPRYRHNGTANFIFADGHAKSVPKGRLNWCKNIYFSGMKHQWDATSLDWAFDDPAVCKNYGKP